MEAENRFSVDSIRLDGNNLGVIRTEDRNVRSIVADLSLDMGFMILLIIAEVVMSKIRWSESAASHISCVC